MGARRLGAGRSALALRTRTLGTLKPDPALDALLDWLRPSLPPGCAAAAIAVNPRAAGPFNSEERLIERAVASRRYEFRAGRAVAREALGQLGCPPTALLAHPQRDPIWPPGYLGSIAHTRRWALAIAARTGALRAVGVDLEEDSAMEPELIDSVCRRDEREQAPLLARLGIDHAKLCFVAKEAIYKAIFPQRRVPLEFHDVRVRFDTAHGTFAADAALTPGQGRYLHGPGVLAAVFVQAADVV